jgi:hypothetical protein
MNQASGHATGLDQYRFFAIFDHRGFRLSRIERGKRGGGTPTSSGPGKPSPLCLSQIH